MKKIILLLLAVLIMTSLVACEGQKENEPIPTPDNTIIDDGGKQQETVPTIEEMYGALMKDYEAALSEYDLEDFESDMTIGDKYPMVSTSLIAHIARYADNDVKLSYINYDVDNNGIQELLVGASGNIGAIYSYNEIAYQPCIIYFQETLERGSLSVYNNGIIFSEGSGGAALHYYEFGKMASNGISYERLEAIEEEYVEGSESPIYRDCETEETLNYKGLDEIITRYLGEATDISANITRRFGE